MASFARFLVLSSVAALAFGHGVIITPTPRAVSSFKVSRSYVLHSHPISLEMQPWLLAVKRPTAYSLQVCNFKPYHPYSCILTWVYNQDITSPVSSQYQASFISSITSASLDWVYWPKGFRFQPKGMPHCLLSRTECKFYPPSMTSDSVRLISSVVRR